MIQNGEARRRSNYENRPGLTAISRLVQLQKHQAGFQMTNPIAIYSHSSACAIADIAIPENVVTGKCCVVIGSKKIRQPLALPSWS
jgi:hypothetical protein